MLPSPAKVLRILGHGYHHKSLGIWMGWAIIFWGFWGPNHENSARPGFAALPACAAGPGRAGTGNTVRARTVPAGRDPQGPLGRVAYLRQDRRRFVLRPGLQ